MRVRRSFAAPFVLIAALPACHKEPKPEPPTRNPPMIPQDAAEVVTTPADAATLDAPEQVAQAQTWTVFKSKGKCTAADDSICRFPPGQPAPPCNPPAPKSYDCPPGLDENAQTTVTKMGESCYLPIPHVDCPKDPNVSCNPPAPRQVQCPK